MEAQAQESELKALMLAGLDGDAAAHVRLLGRLSPRLRAYFKYRLLTIGRAPADAEDLVQEVLISIHTRRRTYDREQLFTPWAHAIARYKLVDYLRRTKASTASIALDETEDALSEEDVIGMDSRLDLEKLLTRLPVKMGTVIRLVKLEGLSVSEAAARSGMSASAVKVSVHRGLKALSRLVRSNGDGS